MDKKHTSKSRIKYIMKNNIINKGHNSNSNGFALIEVIIAITILSVMMISVYQVVENSIATKDRVTKEDRDRLQIAMAITRIETDLEFIHSPLYYDSTYYQDRIHKMKVFRSKSIRYPKSQKNFDRDIENYENKYQDKKYFKTISSNLMPIPVIQNEDKGSITFLTSKNRRLIKDTKVSNFAWIRYRIVQTQYEDDSNKNKHAPYSLTRTSVSKEVFSSDIDLENTKEYVLLDNIKDFSFEFWDAKRKQFVENILELNEIKNAPSLFKLSFVYVSKDGQEYHEKRLIRPIWPFYDVRKELKEKYK